MEKSEVPRVLWQLVAKNVKQHFCVPLYVHAKCIGQSISLACYRLSAVIDFVSFSATQNAKYRIRGSKICFHSSAPAVSRLCQLSQLSVSPSQLRRCWVGPAVAYLTT